VKICLFLRNICPPPLRKLFLAQDPLVLPTNVPDEIWLNVLSFKPRTELNDCLFVNRHWANLIERAGAQLPQLQPIDMKVRDQPNEPIVLTFSRGILWKKTIQLTEGQEALKVSKNCIMKLDHVQGGFDVLQERFRKVTTLVGGRPVHIKKFNFELMGPIQSEENFEEWTRFHANHSGMLFLNYIIYIY